MHMDNILEQRWLIETPSPTRDRWRVCQYVPLLHRGRRLRTTSKCITPLSSRHNGGKKKVPLDSHCQKLRSKTETRHFGTWHSLPMQWCLKFKELLCPGQTEGCVSRWAVIQSETSKSAATAQSAAHVGLILCPLVKLSGWQSGNV